MEYLDVLDEKGNPTGEKKSRTEIHRDGDWHQSAHIWIMNSKHELLMQKRSPNVENEPNLWDISSAGHIPTGANALDTAMREVREELGLILSSDIFSQMGKCILVAYKEQQHRTSW